MRLRRRELIRFGRRGGGTGATASSGGAHTGGANTGGASSGGSSSGGSSSGGSAGTASGGSAGLSSGGGAGAGSGGSAGAAGGNCKAEPSQDSQCVGTPPHFQACSNGAPYAPPAGCVNIYIGNATDFWCCP
ncbi:MAG: hypothetical protein U0263_08710 [Polyangiaceae bacterium]